MTRPRFWLSSSVIWSAGGHSVGACISAELALDAIESPGCRPDILITDETLPCLSVAALAAKLLGVCRR